MLKLYFLRHGQTEYNLEGRVHGWHNAPLTDLGIYQAKCAGYGARKISFDCAYCGDAGRQIQTAETFLSQNEKPCEVVPDMHFREMGYGKFEDRTYQEMLGPLYEKVNQPFDGYEGLYHYYSDLEIGKMIEESDDSGTFEGPEKAALRLLEGIGMLCQKYKEGDILISTSSFAICLVIHKLFPDFHQERLVDNASLTIIGFEDDVFSMISYNDTSYRKAGEAFFSQETASL